jgi:hypothetical protein
MKDTACSVTRTQFYVSVVVVSESETVLVACNKHRPRLLLIGHSVPPEKRLIGREIRNECAAPILELGAFGGPYARSLLEADGNTTHSASEIP